MPGMLHKLENNEAILLMYLADELPAEDRAEVEHMLARDGGLRAELEQLKHAQDAVAGGIQALDRAEALPASDDASMRRLLRDMRRLQVELAARPAAPVIVAARRKLPGWTYPLIGAAAAAFLVVGLWGVGAYDLPWGKDRPIAQKTHDDGPDDVTPVAAEPAADPWFFDPTDTALDVAKVHLTLLQETREEGPG